MGVCILCTSVGEEGVGEKSTDSETPSRLSYTLSYFSLPTWTDATSLGCDNRCTCVHVSIEFRYRVAVCYVSIK